MADSLKLLEQDLRLGADAASKERAPVPADKVRQLLTAIADRLAALPKQEWLRISRDTPNKVPIVVLYDDGTATFYAAEQNRFAWGTPDEYTEALRGSPGVSIQTPTHYWLIPPPPTVDEREGL